MHNSRNKCKTRSIRLSVNCSVKANEASWRINALAWHPKGKSSFIRHFIQVEKIFFADDDVGILDNRDNMVFRKHLYNIYYTLIQSSRALFALCSDLLIRIDIPSRFRNICLMVLWRNI